MKKELETSFSTRQYMVQKDYEIYYYNTNKITPVKDHKHNYYEFYFFMQGNVKLYIDGKEKILEPYDVVIVPPDVAHHSTMLDQEIPYRRFVFWISQEYFNQLFNESKNYGYLFQHIALTKKYIFHFDQYFFNELSAKLINLIEESKGNYFGKDVKTRLLVNDLIISLNRRVYEQDNKNSSRENLALYEKVISYIGAHLNEEITLDTLAENFYVSKYHISHIFKENLGISVHQYILKKRLHSSKDSIISGEEITTAYLKLGFNDYSSFYRAFKKEYGISPKEYKETYCNPNL